MRSVVRKIFQFREFWRAYKKFSKDEMWEEEISWAPAITNFASQDDILNYRWWTF